jgi:hypothetical protein
VSTWLIGAAIVVTAAGTPGPAQGSERPATWYVRAGATAGGDGSRGSPFRALARVEAASRPGDRIVVLRAPRAAGPLDGGIKLKRRQRLIGAGRSVAHNGERERAPRLTNTSADHLDGDAVRLADGATVRNLVISRAQRGAVYGLNAGRVAVVGNDISGQNVSCARGFHIPPFNVPTTAPGAGVPISEGLINGWAGIMLDAARGRSRVTVRGNRVHDADCGDGIDIRVWGHARVRALIRGNGIADLRQGENLESILAIGLQTRDQGRLIARVDRNRQRGLGNDEDSGTGPEGADSEGIFINPVGPSRLRASVTRNSYTHTPGRGGFSANGLEFVSMDDGARGSVQVSNSIFSGPPGDVVEQLALGTNAHLSLRLTHVVATASTGFGGSGFGDTVIIPGNNGDCLIAASGGAGNVVELQLRDAALTDCANNGLTLGSAVANGQGPTAELSADIADSRITGNQGGNLRVGNLTELERLAVRVENTDLGDSEGTASTPANLTVEELGSTDAAAIDVGGGALGSTGGVCLDGGQLAAAVTGYDVSLRNAWWGDPGGPAPGRVVAAGGTLDAGSPLGSAPAGC